MDIVNELFESQKGNLIEKLSQSGFSEEQASGFLPAVSQSIFDSIGKNGADNVFQAFMSSDLGGFMNMIDVTGLSEKINLDQNQVVSGLNAIWPTIQGYITGDQSSEILQGASMFRGMLKSVF